MDYLLTPSQITVLQDKLLIHINAFATEIAIAQCSFLLHSPLRVEEASMEQTKLLLQEATPAQ